MLDVPRVPVTMLDPSLIYNIEIAPSGKSRGRGPRRKAYKNMITAFDIETSVIPKIERSVMYIWQWDFNNEFTVIGRTWEELRALVGYIKKSCEERGVYLVTYVHNLAYEFSFLQSEFEFTDVFATHPRKVLRAVMDDAIELRCSYLLSNMSLDLFCKQQGCVHRKLSGEEFDYNEVRYPWTELTDRQLDYAQMDVVALVEAVRRLMESDNDNLYTIPMTSTGYVRREVRECMQRIGGRVVTDVLPDFTIFTILHEAYRGGDTHTNRYYANVVLYNVASADRSSSYPDVLCNQKYPRSKFVRIKDPTPEKINEYITKRHKAVIMRVRLYGVRLADKYNGAPYLAQAKCRNITKAVYDNGRILSADALETSITDIDYKIIVKEYDFDGIEIVDAYSARYGKLPEVFIRLICDYYDKKTRLKGHDINSEDPEERDAAILYAKSKNRINSIYGMTATSPIHPRVIYTGDDDFPWTIAEDDPAALLEKSNERAFISYAWGVWTTAHARYELRRMIWEVQNDERHDFVYCDTDSVKYLGDADFTEYNNEKIELSKASGAFATDPKGEVHYMGVAENEGTYDAFKSLGAKKYVTVENGELHCTIAGVNKRKGAEELTKAGGIDSFSEGFIFTLGGGLAAKYHDTALGDIEIDGHTLHVSADVTLMPSEYTVGLTNEYRDLINICKSEITFE